jgi:hypothetical protein
MGPTPAWIVRFPSNEASSHWKVKERSRYFSNFFLLDPPAAGTGKNRKSINYGANHEVQRSRYELWSLQGNHRQVH